MFEIGHDPAEIRTALERKRHIATVGGMQLVEVGVLAGALYPRARDRVSCAFLASDTWGFSPERTLCVSKLTSKFQKAGPRALGLVWRGTQRLLVSSHSPMYL